MENPSDLPLFSSIVNKLTKGLYVVQDDRAVFLNSRFGEVFGYHDVSPLIGRSLFEEIYPDPPTVDLFRQVHERMLCDNSPTVSWAQLSARKDGTPFWLEVEAHLIEVDGRPAIFGTFHDQTDCQLIAKAMHVSQETLKLLLDAMEDRVYVVTDDYRIVYANRKMLEAIDGELEDQPCHVACRGYDLPCDDCSKDEVFASDRPLYKEFYNHKTNCWYSVIELAIRMPESTQLTKLAVARDITNRKKAEQSIRALTHRLLTAQEDERKRLARDLHDDLGQRLNAVKVGLDMLADDCACQQEGIQAQIINLSQIVEDTINSVRQITAGLRPPALERLGLVEALHDHFQRIEAMHQLTIDFKTAGMKGIKLDHTLDIKLFRMVQEALNNVVRHARAKNVAIRLVASHPMIRLRIQDDGCGFDVHQQLDTATSGGHFGLLGMAERAELLNGRFQIDSSPGKGTRILIEMPYESTLPDDTSCQQQDTGMVMAPRLATGS